MIIQNIGIIENIIKIKLSANVVPSIPLLCTVNGTAYVLMIVGFIVLRNMDNFILISLSMIPVFWMIISVVGTLACRSIKTFVSRDYVENNNN